MENIDKENGQLDDHDGFFEELLETKNDGESEKFDDFYDNIEKDYMLKQRHKEDDDQLAGNTNAINCLSNNKELERKPSIHSANSSETDPGENENKMGTNEHLKGIYDRCSSMFAKYTITCAGDGNCFIRSALIALNNITDNEISLDDIQALRVEMRNTYNVLVEDKKKAVRTEVMVLIDQLQTACNNLLKEKIEVGKIEKKESQAELQTIPANLSEEKKENNNTVTKLLEGELQKIYNKLPNLKEEQRTGNKMGIDGSFQVLDNMKKWIEIAPQDITLNQLTELRDGLQRICSDLNKDKGNAKNENKVDGEWYLQLNSNDLAKMGEWVDMLPGAVSLAKLTDKAVVILFSNQFGSNKEIGILLVNKDGTPNNDYTIKEVKDAILDSDSITIVLNVNHYQLLDSNIDNRKRFLNGFLDLYMTEKYEHIKKDLPSKVSYKQKILVVENELKCLLSDYEGEDKDIIMASILDAQFNYSNNAELLNTNLLKLVDQIFLKAIKHNIDKKLLRETNESLEKKYDQNQGDLKKLQANAETENEVDINDPKLRIEKGESFKGLFDLYTRKCDQSNCFIRSVLLLLCPEKEDYQTTPTEILLLQSALSNTYKNLSTENKEKMETDSVLHLKDGYENTNNWSKVIDPIVGALVLAKHTKKAVVIFLRDENNSLKMILVSENGNLNLFPGFREVKREVLDNEAYTLLLNLDHYQPLSSDADERSFFVNKFLATILDERYIFYIEELHKQEGNSEIRLLIKNAINEIAIRNVGITYADGLDLTTKKWKSILCSLLTKERRFTLDQLKLGLYIAKTNLENRKLKNTVTNKLSRDITGTKVNLVPITTFINMVLDDKNIDEKDKEKLLKSITDGKSDNESNNQNGKTIKKENSINLNREQKIDTQDYDNSDVDDSQFNDIVNRLLSLKSTGAVNRALENSLLSENEKKRALELLSKRKEDIEKQKKENRKRKVSHLHFDPTKKKDKISDWYGYKGDRFKYKDKSGLRRKNKAKTTDRDIIIEITKHNSDVSEDDKNTLLAFLFESESSTIDSNRIINLPISEKARSLVLEAICKKNEPISIIPELANDEIESEDESSNNKREQEKEREKSEYESKMSFLKRIRRGSPIRKMIEDDRVVKEDKIKLLALVKNKVFKPMKKVVVDVEALINSGVSSETLRLIDEAGFRTENGMRIFIPEIKNETCNNKKGETNKIENNNKASVIVDPQKELELNKSMQIDYVERQNTKVHSEPKSKKILQIDNSANDKRVKIDSSVQKLKTASLDLSSSRDSGDPDDSYLDDIVNEFLITLPFKICDKLARLDLCEEEKKKIVKRLNERRREQKKERKAKETASLLKRKTQAPSLEVQKPTQTTKPFKYNYDLWRKRKLASLFRCSKNKSEQKRSKMKTLDDVAEQLFRRVPYDLVIAVLSQEGLSGEDNKKVWNLFRERIKKEKEQKQNTSRPESEIKVPKLKRVPRLVEYTGRLKRCRIYDAYQDEV